MFAAGASALAVKSDWIPIVPSAANGFGGKADLNGVPTVFAGRWRDTSVTLDPARFRGSVAVFVSSKPRTPVSIAGRARRGFQVLSCDSVPDKFGADAAARVEEAVRADSAAGRGGRGGGGGGGGRGGAGGAAARDTRAEAAGAVAVLIISTDSIPQAAITGAFNGRMSMQSAAPTAPAGALAAATITPAAAERLFGKPADQLTVGAS